MDSTTIEWNTKKSDDLMRYTEGHFMNAQGLKLVTYKWSSDSCESKAPKAILVAAHGFATHIRFEYLRSIEEGSPEKSYEGSWMETLNKAGFLVYGLDNQSHGQSEGLEGLMGYIKDYRHLVNDYLHFLRLIKEENKSEDGAIPKVFMIGGSMGGMIVARSAEIETQAADGAILLAPMISIERVTNKGLNRILKLFAPLAAAWLPKAELGQAAINTRFPKLQEAMDKDKLCRSGRYYKVRACTAYQMLKASRETNANLSKITMAFITFHSRTDEYTDPEGSQSLFHESQSTDKTIEWVDHMWHALHSEPGNEAILERVIEWISSRC